MDHVARPDRAAGQSFALANREQLDAVVVPDKFAVDIVDLAAMKLRVVKMRSQESLVIVAGDKTNFLAIGLVGHFQA